MVAVLAVVTLLLPVPWLHVISDDPPGSAWRLDGRLEVDGQVLDPPGRWTWLAVGRPQLVGEVIWDRVVGTDDPPKDLRSGSVTHRPALGEPSAAAVGLLHAGWDIQMRLIVEARSPRYEGYPEWTLIESVDGIALTDRQAWERASAAWESPPAAGATQPDGDLTFRVPDGRVFTAPGPGLPYDVINTMDLAPQELQAGITFGITRHLPVDWFRSLSLGTSHGSMVALTTYAAASGQDIAQGRHIAGTGGIRGDGTITRIGGLPAKASAAKRAGADVLLVPASQVHELDDVDLTGVTVVPWRTLGEGIEWLKQPVA